MNVNARLEQIKELEQLKREAIHTALKARRNVKDSKKILNDSLKVYRDACDLIKEIESGSQS